MKFLEGAPRFLFFTSKGGVGKTSIDCATAIQLLVSGHHPEALPARGQRRGRVEQRPGMLSQLGVQLGIGEIPAGQRPAFAPRGTAKTRAVHRESCRGWGWARASVGRQPPEAARARQKAA